MADRHKSSSGGDEEELSCLARSDKCRTAWYRFMGSSILKKIIQLHLNRVAVLIRFTLNRVRIEGFQQHNPNQTSFKSPPPPPHPEKFPPLYITITWQNRLKTHKKIKYLLPPVTKKYRNHDIHQIIEIHTCT